VLERCGCFQGDGANVNGVDIARIVEFFPADDDKLDLNVLDEVDVALRVSLQDMRDAPLNARAKRVLAEALRLQQVLHSELGDSFDKKEVADALKELAEGMKQLAIWEQDELGMTPEAFMRLCANFAAGALKEALATLNTSAQLDEQNNEGKALSRIAQLDVNPLIVAANFVKMASKVAAAAKRRADMLQGQTMGLDIGAQADEIRATFDHLVCDMDALDVQKDKECS